jgi:hypothetical protein
MSLRYKFRKAGKIIQGLRPEERVTLGNICCDIQQAEKDLLKAAEDILNDCGKRCRGLCCRNIHIDDIMTLLDCVHILATVPRIQADVDEALTREALHSADCIFLKNGSGPCIFPAEARPEKCILSFCHGDGIVASEMRHVRKRFNRLARFIQFQKPRAVIRFLLGRVTAAKVGRSLNGPAKRQAVGRSNRGF